MAGVGGLATTGCTVDEVQGDQRISIADGAVRIAAANLTSGGPPTYDAGHGQRILAGIDADIVLINEFNVGDSSDGALREFVDTTFGSDFAVFREPDRRLPNGVISRFPIVESGTFEDSETDDREFAFARLDVPGDRDLWAVSVHLLTTSTARRRVEAEDLVAALAGTVPPDDLLVVGGDFNTGSLVEAAWDELDDALVIDGPRPEDGQGDSDTNGPRNQPFDHVLPNAALAQLRVPTQIGSNEFPDGLVVDTRIYQPLSDLAPAEEGDSGAASMQHMAVLVDFALGSEPDPDPDPEPEPEPEPEPDPDPGPAEVVVNEILANEPGGDTGGEFVELVNTGARPASLGGFTLADATAQRHAFPPGTVLEPGASLVVTGGQTGLPNSQVASSGTLSLSNSGDSVVLQEPGGVSVQLVAYTRALTARDGVSMTRQSDGDADSPLILHDEVSSLPSSPNQRSDGTPF